MRNTVVPSFLKIWRSFPEFPVLSSLIPLRIRLPDRVRSDAAWPPWLASPAKHLPLNSPQEAPLKNRVRGHLGLGPQTPERFGARQASGSRVGGGLGR